MDIFVRHSTNRPLNFSDRSYLWVFFKLLCCFLFSSPAEFILTVRQSEFQIKGVFLLSNPTLGHHWDQMTSCMYSAKLYSLCLLLSFPIFIFCSKKNDKGGMIEPKEWLSGSSLHEEMLFLNKTTWVRTRSTPHIFVIYRYRQHNTYTFAMECIPLFFLRQTKIHYPLPSLSFSIIYYIRCKFVWIKHKMCTACTAKEMYSVFLTITQSLFC